MYANNQCSIINGFYLCELCMHISLTYQLNKHSDWNIKHAILKSPENSLYTKLGHLLHQITNKCHYSKYHFRLSCGCCAKMCFSWESFIQNSNFKKVFMC